MVIYSCEGNTAAHYACMQNNEEIMRLLLEANCQLSIRNHRNQTPLDYTTSDAIKRLIITGYGLMINGDGDDGQ